MEKRKIRRRTVPGDANRPGAVHAECDAIIQAASAQVGAVIERRARSVHLGDKSVFPSRQGWLKRIPRGKVR